MNQRRSPFRQIVGIGIEASNVDSLRRSRMPRTRDFIWRWNLGRDGIAIDTNNGRDGGKSLQHGCTGFPLLSVEGSKREPTPEQNAALPRMSKASFPINWDTKFHSDVGSDSFELRIGRFVIVERWSSNRALIEFWK